MVTRDCIHFVSFHFMSRHSSLVRATDTDGALASSSRARSMASSSSFRPPVKTPNGANARVSSGFEATPMDVHFLDAYDVSASDEETPNDRAEGKTVDETTVARDDAVGAKREREMETTASRDDASRNAEATEARARVEDGTRDDDATMTTTTTTTTTTPVRSIRPVGDRSSREEPPMKASRSTPTRSTRIAETPKWPTSSEGGDIVFKVPSSRQKRSESGGVASVVRVEGVSERGASVEEAPVGAAPRAHREDAMKLSPSDEFDFEDELKVSPPRPPPSPEAEEDETAREEIARASQRLDELKGRVEEFVLDSTELLLDTITTTNDYLLLFNPKLMLKLRTIKAEAVEWLDRAESKTKTKD